MSAPPLVIQGMLVDVKNINTHKCVRLSIDVSAELGAEIVNAFGWPTMVDPVNVVVARLNALAEVVEEIKPKDRRKLADLPPATQAALLCQREAFWRFLREEWGYPDCDSEADAAMDVRDFCEVASRADIAGNPQALEHWHHLLSAFLAWMTEPTL